MSKVVQLTSGQIDYEINTELILSETYVRFNREKSDIICVNIWKIVKIGLKSRHE